MTSIPRKTNRKSIGFKVGFVSHDSTQGDILAGSYSDFYSKTIHPQSFDDFQNRTTILYLTKQEEASENAKEERTATARRIKAARLLDLIEILTSPLADDVFVSQFLHFYRTFTVYRITPNAHDPKITLKSIELLHLLKLRFVGPHFFATPSVAKVWQEHKTHIRGNILSFIMLWIQKCYRSDFAENDFELHNRTMITMHDLDRYCEEELKDKSFGTMFEKIIDELERQKSIYPLAVDRLKLEQKPRGTFAVTVGSSQNGGNISPSSTLRGSLDIQASGNSSPTRPRSISLADENDFLPIDKTATLTRAEVAKLTSTKGPLDRLTNSVNLKRSTEILGAHDRKVYATQSMDDAMEGGRDRSRTEDFTGFLFPQKGAPQRTKSGTGTKISIDAIAKEMCLIEHELFSRIQAKEYIKQIWTKKNKEQDAPHIMDVQTWFNQISMWISSEIVKSSTPQQRASVITKYVELANQLRQHNNFNGLMEVLVALNSSSISRLKLSWDLVSSSMKEKFEELNSVMDPQGHFANYRACLSKAMKEGLPCVPFLGVCLSDFTFIDEGNSDTIDEDLINFMKIRMMNHEYQRYVACVSKLYQFESSEFTRTFLFGIELWNEQDLQKLSLMREPRKKSDEPEITTVQKRSLFKRKNTVRFLDCAIDEVELDMTDRDWKLLLSCAVPIVFIKDQVIIDERTSNTCMYKIKSGSVKVVKFADGGKERKVLKSLTEGAFFGEMSMLNVISGLTSASIIAETDTVELYTLERDLVETLFTSEPKLAAKFYFYTGKILADRYDRTSSQITPTILKEVQELREKQHHMQNDAQQDGTWSSSVPLNQRKLKVRKKTFLNRRVAEEAQIETQIISDQLQEKLAAELDKSLSDEYNLSSLEYDRKELAKKVTIALAPHLVNENTLELKIHDNTNQPSTSTTRQPLTKVPSTSEQTDTYDDELMSAKDKKLLKRFKLESDQIILKEYPCVLKQKVNVKAKLYLTRGYACVFAKPFGYKMKKRVVLKSVTSIEISLKLLIIRWDVEAKKVVLELPSEQDACEAEAFLKALWIWHKQTNIIVGRSATMRVSTIDQLRPTKFTNKQVSSLTAALIEQFVPNSSSKKKAEKEKKVLTDRDWEQLIGGTKSVSYQKGEVISHGKSSNKQRLYQIVSGTCRIESVVNGKVELIGALTAPDVFGIPSFFVGEDEEDSDTGGTIIADTDDVSVIKIEGHFINVLISMYPELGARFYKYLSVVLARRIWERERLVFKY